jgi:hypothetical protein
MPKGVSFQKSHKSSHDFDRFSIRLLNFQTHRKEYSEGFLRSFPHVFTNFLQTSLSSKSIKLRSFAITHLKETPMGFLTV